VRNVFGRQRPATNPETGPPAARRASYEPDRNPTRRRQQRGSCSSQQPPGPPRRCPGTTQITRVLSDR
jgi:hypothetical protein